MRVSSLVLISTFASFSTACSVAGHGHHVHENKDSEIHDEADATMADFDIVHARVTRNPNALVFHMHVSGKAGATSPTARGTLASAEVFSYVWPTSLDSSVVGFEPDQGILAFAVTAHPDFDDTPSMMKTETAAKTTMAFSGTATGSCWCQMRLADQARSKSKTSPKGRVHASHRPGPACRSRSTVPTFQ